ncbi:MAG: hypothetical protein K2N70_00950, partial [Helicobacter sp.]|nr:hypothetical protein [Helicobacter sp.]
MRRISDECAQFRTSNVIASKAKQSTVFERSLGILCSLIATLVALARNDTKKYWRCDFSRTR